MYTPLSFRARVVGACAAVTMAALFGTPVFAFGGGSTLAGNATLDTVFTYAGGAYTDKTTAASNATANDVTFKSTTLGDYLYLGSQSPFDQINADVGTMGSSDGGLTYEYVSGQILGGNVYKTVTATELYDGATKVLTVSWTRPDDWMKGTVNGVSAYWVRIKTIHGYSAATLLSQIRARVYNVKVRAQIESGQPVGSFTGVTFTNCGSNEFLGTSPDQTNSNIYLSLRTDGGSCTPVVKFAGFLSASVPLSGLTTTLQDKSAQPVTLLAPLKVVVQDEVGNSLPAATVSWNGAQAAFTNANAYYFPVSAAATGQINVQYDGYVYQIGALGGNAGFASLAVSDTQSAQTVVTLAPGNSSCATLTAAVNNACAPLARNTRFTVQTANGTPIANAIVSVAVGNTISDDLSAAGSTHDANKTTDANGTLSFALTPAAQGYVATISAAGYTTVTTPIAVQSGVKINGNTVTLTANGNPPPPMDTTVSASQSTVVASPAIVAADGVSASTVSVTVKNAAGQVLSGKSVTLAAILSGLTSTPSIATTDVNGVATFALKSSSPGTVTVAAFADNKAVTQTVDVQFTNNPVPPPPPPGGQVVSCQQSINSGALLKLPDDGNPNTQTDTAVYYIGTDCKRHAFSNSKVYFSWYADFSGVTVVPASTMSAFSLGKNVTYRPGTKMVKFQSLNSVYVIAKKGVLRWVKTEAAASGLYGATWNKKVDDISDAFFMDYTFGADVNSVADYSIATEQNATPTISDNF